MINRIWLDEANKTVNKIEKERFINNENYYINHKNNDRTKKRLIQIFDLGLREVGYLQFGIKGKISGLYIENLWNDTKEEWNLYIRRVKTFVPFKKEKEAKEIIKQLQDKVNNTKEKIKFPNLTSIIRLLKFYDIQNTSGSNGSNSWILKLDGETININTDKHDYSSNTYIYACKIIDVLKKYNIIK